MASRKVLVVTMPPYEGGVPAKTRILCRHLRDRGHRVTVAWYATFKYQPHLNRPSWRLAASAPESEKVAAFTDFAGIAVGCRLPELEAPYYQPSPRWQALIDDHDRHIAVGGPPLVGHILAAAGQPFLLWCASDAMADRADRQARMTWPRRMVDWAITRPWLQAQQRRTLRDCPLSMGVSAYTVDRLRAVGCRPERSMRLPIPVDCRHFQPPSRPAAAAIIGFAGRFEDPRKNLSLLLHSCALLRRADVPLRLRLAGATPSDALRRQVAALGLHDAVEFLGEIPTGDLPGFYQGLDIFALPSHQEGLCIAGLEAMACGVPVVSTRCGGPEDYVVDAVTGLLAEADPAAFAAALRRLAEDRDLRAALSGAARAKAMAEFSPSAFASGLDQAWTRVWGDPP